jgi:formate hydrogenlyase subunit 3/multisubunit Na+/H+ antiporter MnhD subunit
MGWALVTVLALPLAATAVAVADGWRGARAVTLVAGLGALGLAVWLAIGVAGGGVDRALGGWLRLDSLGAVFLVATAFLDAVAAAAERSRELGG